MAKKATKSKPAKKKTSAPYRFKAIREAAGMTLEDLSGRAGVSVSQLSRFESGEREPRVIELMRIAALLGVDWQEFVAENKSGTEMVSVLSWVSAGHLTETAPGEAFEDAPKIKVSGLGPGDWIALRVDGSSMDRISPPESVILVNRKEKSLFPNACYVILDDEGLATYKRYRPDPDRFEPVTFSEGHDTIFPDGEPVIIGRVRKSILDL